MPPQFRFFIHDDRHFAASLVCERCEGTTKTGQRCTRSTCIGTRWCFQHLVSVKHLHVHDSTIHGAGKGLFAKDPKQDPDAILFNKGDKIIAYDGELINDATLKERYGAFTAPYGIQISQDRFEDGALHRGIGSLTNHRPTAQCNARFSVSHQRIVLVATKRIRNDREILVNYGRSYRFNEPTAFTTRR